ncbi:hypothetical protein M0R45_009047 [Rubus argutus]|uniref:Zinc finger GRF-type domain-containing protein n=1 Tax=Rubus argutus TaxID=59490 RepID=A0AAW1Y5X1_RUBAR
MENHGFPPHCFYGVVSPVLTCWTEENPGQWFHGCYREQDGCNFFFWIDVEMCPRSMEVIPELKRHIHNLEELVLPMLVDEAEELEEVANRAREREEKLSLLLIVCWFCFVDQTLFAYAYDNPKAIPSFNKQSQILIDNHVHRCKENQQETNHKFRKELDSFTILCCITSNPKVPPKGCH